jgi:hypothetical protein
MADTIYLNGIYCKKKTYGIGISGKASDIIAEIQKHTNSKGYVRLELKERKEPDKNGNTHYLIVDTYEPQAQQQRPQERQTQSTYSNPEDIDLPF